eukprot:1104848-Heterocapsa_arctica.AAC.1
MELVFPLGLMQLGNHDTAPGKPLSEEDRVNPWHYITTYFADLQVAGVLTADALVELECLMRIMETHDAASRATAAWYANATAGNVTPADAGAGGDPTGQFSPHPGRCGATPLDRSPAGGR